MCQLNLANGIARFLPDLGRRSAAAVGWVYFLTGTAALAVGVGFVLAAPHVSHELKYIDGSPGLAGVFVGALILWGIFTLQDAVLVATRRAPWIPVENGVFGVLKLAALPLLLLAGASQGVFVAWVVPMALLLLPMNLLIFRHAIPGHVRTVVRESSLARLGRARAARFLAQDYLASIFTQATLTILPFIVIGVLGARDSAYFAMPFTIVLAFDTFAYGACSSLVVEATLDQDNLRQLARLFAKRVLTVVVLAAGVLVLAAPLLMLPFGHVYEQHGVGTLRLLLCASIFRVLLAFFSAIMRVQGRGMRLAAVELSLMALVVAPAVMLARHHGIEGVAFGWLGANAIVALAAIPLLIRALREPRTPAKAGAVRR